MSSRKCNPKNPANEFQVSRVHVGGPIDRKTHSILPFPKKPPQDNMNEMWPKGNRLQEHSKNKIIPAVEIHAVITSWGHHSYSSKISSCITFHTNSIHMMTPN